MKLRHFLSILFIAITTLLLASCSHLAMLDPKGMIAASEKKLLIDATLLMLVVVIPVILITFYFAWRYRASNKKATYRPNDAHSVPIEIVCWTIPIIIVAILGVMTWVSSHKLDPYRPIAGKGKPITIQAISLNWKWLFIYPNKHIATVNYLQIPVGHQIRFLITSDAPMNSLEIPRLAGQIYAMGGMRTQLHLVADEKGVYRGFSANYSGAGFAGMHFKVHVTSIGDYNRWVKKTQAAPKKLSLATYNQLMKDSENNPVAYYSHVEPKLFEKVLMKFTKPMPGMDTLGDGTKAEKR
jgi:cytochrome o ubiquinol oxidase subunit 2